MLFSLSYTDFDRQVDLKLKYKSITALVEHPISFLPPGEPRVAPFMPVMLTKQVMGGVGEGGELGGRLRA